VTHKFSPAVPSGDRPEDGSTTELFQQPDPRVHFVPGGNTVGLSQWLWDDSFSEEQQQPIDGALLHPDDPTLDEIIGRRFSIYRCDALLGQGGMGRVYLAYHTHLGRPCALKITAPLRVPMKALQTFAAQEARFAASLMHPNIVTVHATGEEQGRQFIEMELVAGGSLKQLIRQEGQLPVLLAMKYATAIAGAIDHAHRQGIRHRDIKPENILICTRGVPKLADFGLAYHMGRIEDLPGGTICGTLPYLAPEVIRSGEHTPQADVYALGVTLYHTLTGELPYNSDSSDELIHLISTAPFPQVRRRRPDIPLNVAEAVSALTARDPDNRPSDGTEAWHLLGSVLGQLRDVKSILDEALGHDPTVSVMRCGEKYQLRVQLPDGRQQRVFMESSDHRSDERLLLIYSICCPTDASFYESALRINAELSHGGLGIREIDGVPHFVMIDTYPRGTVDPEEVRKSVREIATRADAVENYLTGQDRH